MNLAPDTSGMTPIENAYSSKWRFWELKTPNIHRGIVEYSPKTDASIEEIEEELRNTVHSVYKPSWWRGFGFGAVLHFHTSPSFELDRFLESIDDKNRSKGVLQWLIAIDHSKNLSLIHI